jgi:Periplasmic binding protein-like domain
MASPGTRAGGVAGWSPLIWPAIAAPLRLVRLSGRLQVLKRIPALAASGVPHQSEAAVGRAISAVSSPRARAGAIGSDQARCRESAMTSPEKSRRVEGQRLAGAGRLQGGATARPALSVAGFDDLPVARRVSPPLTTARQPLAGMGQATAQMLGEIIEDRSLRRWPGLPAGPIAGNSAGPAR